MQVRRIGYRVKGLYRVARLGMKWGIIAPNTEKRLKILRFWEEHGLKATIAAFEVSRRTLFDWKHRFKTEGARSLAPGSTRPKGRRRAKWPALLVTQIRRLRTLHPNLGCEKLKVLLAPWGQTQGIAIPSERTLGRIIAGAADKMRHSPVRLDPKAARSAGTERAKPANPKGSGQRGRVSAWVSIPSSASVTGCAATSSQHRTSAPVLASPLRYPATGVSGQPRPLISPKQCRRCVSSTHFMIMARSSRDSSPRPPRRPGSPNGIRSREHPK